MDMKWWDEDGCLDCGDIDCYGECWEDPIFEDDEEDDCCFDGKCVYEQR